MRAEGRKDRRDEAKSLSAILRTRLKETQNHIILTTGTALSTASQGLPPSDHAYTNSPNAMSVTIFTSHTLCFFYHCFQATQPSPDVPVDAGFLCNKAHFVEETKKQDPVRF